jgi:hypothetical protein
MRRKSRKPIRREIVLRLPELDHAKSAVLSSLSSPNSRRNYEQFITWYWSEPRLALNRTVVLRVRLYLESLGLEAGKLCEAVPRERGRIGAGPISFWSRLGLDNRALPWVQTELGEAGQ